MSKSLKKDPQTEETEKKSISERVEELKSLASAGKKMLAYIFEKVPWKVTFFILTTVAVATMPFLGSWINSKLIDELVAVVGGSYTGLSTLYTFLVFGLLIAVARNINGSLNRYFEMNVWFTIARELTNDVTRKFASLDIEYYENPETMDLLNKVRENYGHRPQQFTNSLFWLFESLLTIVSGVYILIFFSPVFVLVLVITTLPRVFVNLLYGNRSYGIWGAKGDVRRDYHRSRNYLTSELSLMELRIFKTRQYLAQRVYDLFYSFQKEQIKVENKRTLVLVGVGVLSVLGYGLILVMTVFAVLALKITVGQFNFYISSAGRLQGGLESFFSRFSRAYENGLYVSDIFKVLEMEEKIVSGEVCLPDTKEPPVIKLRDMTFAYPGSDKPVIDKMNLLIRPGEHVAIVGENGAGKSTLIKLLMRFYDVTDGEILVSNINLKDLDIENWYDKVGALFQEFNFYHFDAKTNISVGDTTRMDDFDAIVDASKKAGAHSFIKEYEHEYDQIMSKAFKGGIRPSVGQMQRIALARAFFKDAPILILDEPTSAIDPKAEFEIFEELFNFAKGKTVIIISHRFSTVRNADRILVLDSGKIVEDGSHEELLQIEDGRYKTAFEIQRKGYE